SHGGGAAVPTVSATAGGLYGAQQESGIAVSRRPQVRVDVSSRSGISLETEAGIVTDDQAGSAGAASVGSPLQVMLAVLLRHFEADAVRVRPLVPGAAPGPHSHPVFALVDPHDGHARHQHWDRRVLKDRREELGVRPDLGPAAPVGKTGRITR